jgi:hypothetical protein
LSARLLEVSRKVVIAEEFPWFDDAINFDRDRLASTHRQHGLRDARPRAIRVPAKRFAQVRFHDVSGSTELLLHF